MSQALIVIQILVSIVLSALILLQAKGTGLGRTFGQATYHSKRGMEFVFFRLTIILAVLFVTISVANQFIV